MPQIMKLWCDVLADSFPGETRCRVKPPREAMVFPYRDKRDRYQHEVKTDPKNESARADAPR